MLTDPPYGIGESYASFYDSKDNLHQLVGEIMPLVLAHPVALVTCGITNQHAYPKPDWILAFFTMAGTGRCKWGFSCWQPILAYGSDPYLKNGMGSRADVFQHTESAEKNGHPCPKPIVLWEKIMLRGSVKEQDLIIDPFMGSGTTLRAAKDHSRRAIGIEIEEKYCEIAAKRMAQEVFDFSS